MQGMRLSSETIGCSYERIWPRSWSRLRVLPLHPAGWVAPNLCIPQTCGIFLVRNPVNLMLSLYVCSCFSCCSQYHLHPLYFFRTKILFRAQTSHCADNYEAGLELRALILSQSQCQCALWWQTLFCLLQEARVSPRVWTESFAHPIFNTASAIALNKHLLHEEIVI